MIKAQIKHQLARVSANRERTREEKIIMAQIPKSMKSPLTETEKRAVEKMWFGTCAGGV